MALIHGKNKIRLYILKRSNTVFEKQKEKPGSKESEPGFSFLI